MKLNELVCPKCGLRCFVDAAYTTCDSCQTVFYANQSRTVTFLQPQIYPLPNDPSVTGPGIYPQPGGGLQPPIDLTPFITWRTEGTDRDCSFTTNSDGRGDLSGI